MNLALPLAAVAALAFLPKKRAHNVPRKQSAADATLAKRAAEKAAAAEASSPAPAQGNVVPLPARSNTKSPSHVAPDRKRSPVRATPARTKPAAPSSPSSSTPKAPSSSTPKLVKLSVANAQTILRRLGAPLEQDGLFGPKTQYAWQKAARARKLTETFARVDGRTAAVSQKTAQALAALAKATPQRRAPAPTPAPHAPAPAAAAPNGPPAGYDKVKASRAAPDVARHIAQKKGDYSRQALRVWQKLAGITQDGIYGRGTAAALRFYVGSKAPKALFAQGVDAYPWGQ